MTLKLFLKYGNMVFHDVSESWLGRSMM